jgi:hypothetical protein
MNLFYTLLIAMIVFAIAADWWGVDSRDALHSPEWERRAQYGRAL